jgi:hypothetical protein
MINGFLKIPINYSKDVQIFPPSINEVIKEDNFKIFISILTVCEDDLYDYYTNMVDLPKDFKIPSPLEYLLINCYKDRKFKQFTIDAFNFFCHQKVSFLFDRKEIWFCDLEQRLKEIQSIDELESVEKLTDENFLFFQNKIRQAIGNKEIKPNNPNEDPRVLKIKAKARRRDRLKEKYGDPITLETSLVSICCMGLGLTPLNIGEMSYAAVSKIIRTYQEKDKYDIDIRSLLAGASSDKVHPKNWIRNLND